MIEVTTELVVFDDGLSVFGFTRSPKWHAMEPDQQANTAPLGDRSRDSAAVPHAAACDRRSPT